MPLSDTIAELSKKLDEARAEQASVNTKISDLEHQRDVVLRAPPHTDDIVAVYMRGLKRSEDDFTRQLGRYLNDAFVGDDSAQAAGKTSAQAILCLEDKLDKEAAITRSMRSERPDLNAAALSYFLGDQIAAQIPALIDRLCPAARNGMKQADRDARVAEIDAELVELRARAQELNAGLLSARKAVIPR